MRKLIVGMTGAAGAIGVRLLELLRESDVETHLIASKWALQTVEHETGLAPREVMAMAKVSYRTDDMGAAVSS